MKQTLLTAFFFLFAFTAFAQNDKGIIIKGTVIDSAANAPMAFATVILKDDAGKQTKSAQIKTDGTFELIKVAPQHYTLSFAFMGYKGKTIGVNVKDKSVDVGRILLSAAAGSLKEVSVTANKALVKQEIDRISYNVQADPESKAQTAMEMLRKVPLVTVDADDNIELQGSGSYKIFINGKPSNLLASNPKDVLRAMPASNIQKIEVITTPPAKYDSEGLAGIINIITYTKTTADGYNGTLSTRLNTAWGPNVNLNGTFKQGKFGFSGFGGTGHQFMVNEGTDNVRTTSSTALLQTGVASNGGGGFHYGGGELSFEADTLNLITASVNYDTGDGSQGYNYFTQLAGPVTQSYQLFNDGGYKYVSTEVGLNYQLGFKHNKDQLLTLSYQYSHNSNNRFSNIITNNAVNYTGPNSNQQNNAGTNENTFQLDYVQPGKKLTIEAGAKAILRGNFSNAGGQYLASSGQYVTDNGVTNNFDYDQNIFSAYNSYQLKLTDWTFKAGVRVEHTHVDANFKTNGTNIDNDYTNVVPSISVMRSLKNNQSLTFGFTNRLERPYIQQLNPYVDSTNRQIINTGNPNLKPVASNLVELGYSRASKGSFTIKVSYLHTGNGIQSVTRILSPTLSQTTYDNVGNNKIARLSLNGSIPISAKLNMNYNTGVFYVWISGYYNGQLYSNQGWRTNSFINWTYKVDGGWQFGASGGYNRRYVRLQGGSNDYAYTNFSAAKTLFNKKITATVVINNPFQSRYAFMQYSSTPDFYQSNTSNQIYRTFGFSLSYKFGRLNADIKKNQRSINNDDKGGGNN